MVVTSVSIFRRLLWSRGLLRSSVITVILDPKIVAELELKIVTLDFQKTLALLLAKMCHMKLSTDIHFASEPSLKMFHFDFSSSLWMQLQLRQHSFHNVSHRCKRFTFTSCSPKRSAEQSGYLSWHLIFFRSLRCSSLEWDEYKIELTQSYHTLLGKGFKLSSFQDVFTATVIYFKSPPDFAKKTASYMCL